MSPKQIIRGNFYTHYRMSIFISFKRSKLNNMEIILVLTKNLEYEDWKFSSIMNVNGKNIDYQEYSIQ